jgi:hypothetical protein
VLYAQCLPQPRPHLSPLRGTELVVHVVSGEAIPALCDMVKAKANASSFDKIFQTSLVLERC